MRVYLAGPDVFLPDPLRRAADLKAICARHGLLGISPLDPVTDAPTAWAALPKSLRIARCNERHIAGCAALIANLTPFRGPSADAGTVFELGYQRALGRPVFGWSNVARPFTERTRDFLQGSALQAANGAWHDPDGLLIEAFGLSDNLMIDGAILASGGALFTADVPAASRWTALEAFETCVAAVARKLAQDAAAG